MFNVRIHLDLYVYTSYVSCDVFKKISLRLTVSFIQTTLLWRLKIDIIIKQDGRRLMPFVLQYFRNYACYE